VVVRSGREGGRKGAVSEYMGRDEYFFPAVLDTVTTTGGTQTHA